MRIAKPLLLVALLTPVAACAPKTRPGAISTMVAGGVMSGAGLFALTGASGRPERPTPVYGPSFDCLDGGCLVAPALLIAGLALLTSGTIGLVQQAGALPPAE